MLSGTPNGTCDFDNRRGEGGGGGGVVLSER